MQNSQGSEADGTTSIWFSLPLESDEQWDKSIEINSMYPIMLAYGSGADSFRRGHAWRGVYEVNFTSGESKRLNNEEPADRALGIVFGRIGVFVAVCPCIPGRIGKDGA